MKNLTKTFSLVLLISVFVNAQDSTIIKLRSVINGVTANTTYRYTDKAGSKVYNSLKDVPEQAQLVLESPYNDWRYWNGVLNIAMLKAGNVLNDTSCLSFVQKNIEFAFNSLDYFQKKYNNEGKWNYPLGQFFILEELDDGGAMGASVIEIYKKNHDPKLKEYIDKVADHITKIQSRLPDGTLVRAFPNKWTLWADDLYMGLSFLTRMGELTGDKKYFDDAAEQVINFNNYLYDVNAGLISHCWFSDVDRRGVAFWGRANGWMMLAQADLLDRLPADHPLRDTLISLFKRHVQGIASYQGPCGLWHQLLDKQDSFYETSCSAMFTYAVARGVNKKYIDSGYASVAETGWKGIMTKISRDGVVTGVCAGTGVGNDLVFYYTRPTPLNDIHGIGAVIMAGTEILEMSKR